MKAQVLAALLAGPLFTAAALWVNSVPRKDTLLFAVHADPQWVQSAEGKRTILVFRLQLVLWLAATLALAFSSFFLVAPALLPVMGTGSFLTAYSRAKKHSVPNARTRTASLAADDAPTGSLLLCAGALLPLTGSALWLRSKWNLIPERFAVHWDLQGHANGWSTKTTGGVFGPLILGAAMNLTLIIIAFAILRAAPRSNSGAARGAAMRGFAGVSWLTNLLLCAISLNQALRLNLPVPLFVVAMLGGMGALLWPLLKAAKGNEDSTPDSAWTAGIFYYNPADPALFVQARYGAGYTLNFGNRISWLIAAASLSAPLIAIVAMRSS